MDHQTQPPARSSAEAEETSRQLAAYTPPEPDPDERWNKRKMADFLRVLAAEQSVAAAARSVGMSRQSAYKLRNRLKGEPFDIAWEAALQHGYDALHQAALERALHGVEVPVWHRGELVGTRRHYDERLDYLPPRAPQQRRGAAARPLWGGGRVLVRAMGDDAGAGRERPGGLDR